MIIQEETSGLLVCLVLVLVLTIFSDYIIIKSIFHKALNLF